MRLFVGLELPAERRAQLALLPQGLPGARFVSVENLHLTLRFIGECDPRTAVDIDSALAAIAHRPFSLSLVGLNVFTPKSPRTLWAGVSASEPLVALAAKVETALQRLGLEPESRKFAPHITLARLKNTPARRLSDYLAAHGGLVGPPFTVDRFTLFSSHRGQEGAHYEAERQYLF